MRLFLISSAVLAFAFITSCKKGDGLTFKQEAELVWTGDYAVDGCGFFLRMGETEYKPENESFIDGKYKVDTLTFDVIVEYKKLNDMIETQCGLNPDPVIRNGITILSLEEQE